MRLIEVVQLCAQVRDSVVWASVSAVWEKGLSTSPHAHLATQEITHTSI